MGMPVSVFGALHAHETSRGQLCWNLVTLSWHAYTIGLSQRLFPISEALQDGLESLSAQGLPRGLGQSIFWMLLEKQRP